MSKVILRKAASMQELAVDFQKDAERLQEKPLKLPFFKVDPKLKIEIGKVTRDIYVATFIPLLAARIVETDTESRQILLAENGVVQIWLKELLEGMKMTSISSSKELVKEDFRLSCSDMPGARDDVELLVRSIQWLIIEMQGHEEALDQIKWGF